MTRARKIRLGSLITVLAALGSWALFMYGGCAGPDPVTGLIRRTEARSQQLLAMAVDEAAQIDDVDVRLTRQLNLAEQQILRGWKADARNTLGDCRSTLSSADAALLSDHARLSGWVSASELARQIKDVDGAALACDGAVAAVNKIADPTVRCQYVMGVSNELQFIKGPGSAASMLSQAGPWTSSIADEQSRRHAVICFATALFNLDEYPSGQSMLRNEGDAAWRSRMLSQLAMVTTAGRRDGAASTVAAQYDRASEDVVATPSAFYGKNLEYRNVFQQQGKSKTD